MTQSTQNFTTYDTHSPKPIFTWHKVTASTNSSPAQNSPQKSPKDTFGGLTLTEETLAKKISRQNSGKFICGAGKVDPELGPEARFRCDKKHNFTVPIKLAEMIWCPMCKRQNDDCEILANEFGWTFKQIASDKYAEFICEKGHLIRHRVTHIKLLKRCQECKRIDEALEAEKNKIEEERIHRENVIEQEKLFEQARKDYQYYLWAQRFYSNNNGESINTNLSTEDEELSEDVKEVEKVTKTNLLLKSGEKDLINEFLKVQKEQRNKIYREFALLIHPDKCKDKEAGEAFKRLVSAYNKAIGI